MHDRLGSFSVMRDIMRRYPNHETVTSGETEPGDILVVGPAEGGPGHMMIVGPYRNTVWQASASKVHFTAFSCPPLLHFFVSSA
jgi:hypothetical protein